jgi:peptidoglycan/LPS O-acetylase OafA/YrhL
LPGLSPQLSLFLDLLRVLAALAVMLCHFGSRRMSGGQAWFLTPYGAQAVDVFFVLSGYLVSQTGAREPSARGFTANRAARIYSVALPAIILTFAMDALGRRLAPGVYATAAGYAPGHPPFALQAASGLLFFNNAWFLGLPMGSNIPWWSLGYEVAYYIAFGLFRYASGAWRWLGPALVAVIAGPNIAALAPLWLAGALVRHLHRRTYPPRRTAWALVLASIAIWAAYEMTVHRWGRPIGILPPLRPELLQDWLIGALFAAFLAGVPSLLSTHTVAFPARALIRFSAGRSFALYLLHYPTMLCLHAAAHRYAPGLSPYWLLPATLALVMLMAEVTERRLPLWRRGFSALLSTGGEA